MLSRSIKSFVLLFIIPFVLTGCGIFGGTDDEKERTADFSEGKLYQRVQDLLDDESWDLAVRDLQLLESRFPFGNYADRAQLEIIYAYYQSGDEEAAVAAAERFIRLHPSHPDVDYAWYLKGLANYSLKPGIFSRFVDTDPSTKDVTRAYASFREFSQFIEQFPNSPYAPDARARMVHIKQVIARHELVVANYYVSRRAYVAALGRAKNVLAKFQGTEAVADALAVTVFCYYQLNQPDSAKDSFEILVENFPGHSTINSAGEFLYGENYIAAKRSRLNRLSLGVIDPPKAPVFDSREG